MVEKLLNTQYMLSCFINFTAMLLHYACLINFPVFIIDVLKGDASIAGLITTAYIFSAMLLRPVGAPMLRKFGKRLSVVLGTAIVLLAAIGFTFGASVLTLLFAIRILNGFGFGLQQIALNTCVVDFIPPNRKGEGLGNFSMFMNIASAVAPITSLGIVKIYGYTALFQICIVLALIAIFAALYLKPQELSKDASLVKNEEHKAFSFKTYFDMKALPAALCGGFAFAFCYTVINTFFPAYARTLPEVKPYIGYFFIIISTALVIARPLIGRVMDKKGEKYVMYPGFIVLAIGMFIISRMDSLMAMVIAGICLGLGYSSLYAGTQSSCIKSTVKERIGQATITFFFFFDLGFALGAYFFGVVAKTIGFSNMYLADSALYLLGLVVYFVFVGRKNTVEEADASTATVYSGSNTR